MMSFQGDSLVSHTLLATTFYHPCPAYKTFLKNSLFPNLFQTLIFPLNLNPSSHFFISQNIFIFQKIQHSSKSFLTNSLFPKTFLRSGAPRKHYFFQLCTAYTIIVINTGNSYTHLNDVISIIP